MGRIRQWRKRGAVGEIGELQHRRVGAQHIELVDQGLRFVRRAMRMHDHVPARCVLQPCDRRPAPATPNRWRAAGRSEEHTSELPSLMRTSYAVFCLKKTKREQ